MQANLLSANWDALASDVEKTVALHEFLPSFAPKEFEDSGGCPPA